MFLSNKFGTVYGLLDINKCAHIYSWKFKVLSAIDWMNGGVCIGITASTRHKGRAFSDWILDNHPYYAYSSSGFQSSAEKDGMVHDRIGVNDVVESSYNQKAHKVQNK